MKNTVFYIVKKFNKPNDNLFDFVERHSFTKYGDKWEASVFAYQTLYKGLNKIYGVNDYNVDFLESGKPIMSGYSVSVSHTSGAVAVAFLKGDLPVGIDLELIGNKKSERLNKLLNIQGEASAKKQYLEFTKRESIIKAHNLNMLTKCNIEFKGISKTVNVEGTEYALSVYFDGEIKEIIL
ncbi:MAG: hypothetical protein IKV61_00825 [Clostridia bacterium]|nr:hypothetical protein [Clostridia bacterium]